MGRAFPLLTFTLWTGPWKKGRYAGFGQLRLRDHLLGLLLRFWIGLRVSSL